MKYQNDTLIEIPRGFSYYTDFISKAEENVLLKNIVTLPWKTIQMYGVIAKRRVVHYGLDYTYSSRVVTPTTPPPKFLHTIIKRSAKLLNLSTYKIAEILITEYLPGAGIGWHKDAPIFGDSIIGISLGAACMMKLRNPISSKNNTHKIQLDPRSAYILSGESRYLWQHAIPPVKQVRYSITLRTLKMK